MRMATELTAIISRKFTAKPKRKYMSVNDSLLLTSTSGLEVRT